MDLSNEQLQEPCDVDCQLPIRRGWISGQRDNDDRVTGVCGLEPLGRVDRGENGAKAAGIVYFDYADNRGFGGS